MSRKKIALLLMTLLATTFAFGVTNNATINYDRGYIVTPDQMNSAYNAPARFDVKGAWDFFLSGSFIFWQPREKGLDVGFLLLDSAGRHNMHMDFEYKPGFKANLGMNFNHDDWNLYAEYTRLVMSTHHSTGHPNEDINWSANWMHDRAGGYTDLSGKWKLNYNTLDLLLGRPYYVGRCLSFKPEVGGRVFWITQKMDADYTNSYGVIKSNNKSSSWALGPKIGFKTNWLLGRGFRFFGDTGCSLAYQHFNVRTKQYDNAAPASIEYYVKNDVGYITPNMELAIGFGWGTYFDHDYWHFDFLIGYDMHYFWNQNMMRNLVDKDKNSSDGAAGNLMLQGLTAGIQFNF